MTEIRNLIRFICFILSLSFTSLFLTNQLSAQLSDRARISILTCDPGNQLYSLFGHSAIRVFDPANSLDDVYNYGTFDFNTPNFGIKFLRGKLLYSLGKSKYPHFLGEYNYYERAVKEQLLNLSFEEKNRLYTALEEGYKPENRDYKYDFFFDNCTTRIRDILEQNNLTDSSEPADYMKHSFRSHLHDFNSGHPWTRFGMDLILGATTDTLASYRDRMFLPEYLFRHYEVAVKSDMAHIKLVGSTKRVLDFPLKKSGFRISPFVFFLGILLIELYLLHSKNNQKIGLKLWDSTWTLALFLSFVIFVFMWFATDHTVCAQNWNILWTSPWLIATLFVNSRSIQRRLYLSALAGSLVFLALTPVIPQYIPSAIYLILGITAIKALRRLGFTLAIRTPFRQKYTVLFTVLLMCSWQSEAQEKIAGVTLVGPPRSYTEDPMVDIRAVNGNWVALVPYAFSRSGEPEVRFGSERQWWGERVEGIERSIAYARDHGMKVMLKPQVWIRGSWVGDMDFQGEADWEIWENSYRNYVMIFVNLAVKHGVEMICIGTEYRISSKKRENYWRKLIRDIRKVYKGSLTYSANWDSYEEVPFWDALDYIGLSSYFPLSDLNTPPVMYLGLKWRKTKRQLRRFSEKYSKKILFTEYGYLSVDGAAGKTWELEDKIRSLDINEQAQSNGYEALFQSFWNEDFWAGGFLWKWFPDGHGHEGYPEKDYTPQGKLAEKVLREWYNKAL